MPDQAAELRNLMQQAARRTEESGVAPPRMLMLAGGKGGVGTTTVASHLAVALCSHGLRVVLVDACLYRGDAAVCCGVNEQLSIVDVLNGRHSIHEILRPGPAGLQVAAGAWAPSRSRPLTQASCERLISQIKTLGRYADLVLIDGGNRVDELTRTFWQHIDEAAFITTTDPVAVMDTYATIKVLMQNQAAADTSIIVNRAASEAAARSVQQRLHRSCQRFLNKEVATSGWVPSDPALSAAFAHSRLLQQGEAPSVEAALDRLAVYHSEQLQAVA